jgi:hypothetical protein
LAKAIFAVPLFLFFTGLQKKRKRPGRWGAGGRTAT